MSDPLDLGGRAATRRVVVAMSGGVDSAVTAAVVQAMGYDVVGLTMQ
ncbi:MAG: tRNA 2-thiouridine(34) synthase MnmA, partial [Pseudomonadota bacterium]